MDDTKGAAWAVVRQPGAKIHYCHRDFAADLAADLLRRFGEETSVEGAEVAFIDLPGMCMSDRPMEKVEIDGTVLEIPSQDFEYYRARLDRAPLRRFVSGREYFKIHGRSTCIVLSPEQKALMAERMDAIMDEVLKRADEADDEFSRRLEEVNRRGSARVVSWRDKKFSEHFSKRPEDLN